MPPLPRRPAAPAGLAAVLLVCVLAGLAATPAAAQSSRPPGRTGIGGQVGDPSGLTLKLYRGTGTRLDRAFGVTAVDVLAAWDLDDFLFVNVHAVAERPIPDSPLRYFIGPGAFVGIDTGPDDVAFGLSVAAGLNVFFDPFEVFVQVIPRIKVVPDTRGTVGAGVGLRYFF